MSTNNNRTGKEIQPIWKSDEAAICAIKKLSGQKLRHLTSTNLLDCTAISLKDRNIEVIDDLTGLGPNLRRFDLSGNKISRLSAFANIVNVSLLNVSSNALKGDSSLEELRYLPELRSLNIGKNESIKAIRSHIFKPLTNLQALIAHDCSLEKTAFVRNLQSLNSLVLSHNLISEFSLVQYGNYVSLSKLSLGHNKLQSVPDLSVCPNLLELRLNHNLISDIPDTISICKKIKTLDLSHNLISSWSLVQRLTKLPLLTNLTIKGNRLPDPGDEAVAMVQVREDLGEQKVMDKEERRYRKYLLSLFQHPVGQQQKPFVQLIVLDARRVKLKWRPQDVLKNIEMVTAAAHVATEREKSERKVTKRTKRKEAALVGYGGSDGKKRKHEAKSFRIDDTAVHNQPKSATDCEEEENEGENGRESFSIELRDDLPKTPPVVHVSRKEVHKLKVDPISKNISHSNATCLESAFFSSPLAGIGRGGSCGAGW